MTNLWPLGLLLCSCLMTTMAGHSKKPLPRFWVLFPKTARADSTMGVGVYITGIESNVSLSLDLYDYDGHTLQDSQTYSISPTDGYKVVNFKFWEKLKRPYYSVYVRVKAWGGAHFDYFERLVWRNRRVTVLLQLDRKLYKPGMKVKFRALAMYADGSVSDEAMDIVMMDPLKNQVAKWTAKKGSGKLGVVEGEILTPEDPMLGEYSITASVKGAKRIKYFTLEQYDEPDFALKVWIPRADYNADYITAKVFANYKIGTPVNGKGTLAVQIPRYYYWWWYRRYHIQQVTKNFNLDRYGKAVVKFSSREMMSIICRYYYPWYWYWYRYRYRCYYSTYYLRYRSVRFIAEVTDAASHQVVKKTKDVYITAYKTQLRFTSDTPYRFKPGLPLTAYVQDVRTNGKPNKKPVQSYLNFTVTYTNSTRCSGRYWYWWWYWWRTTWYTHVETTVDLDAEKIAMLKTTIPADACQVKVKVTNGKFTTYRTMSKYYSINGTYLHVELDKTLSVDKKRTVTVMSNKKFGNFTVKAYSQGSLVMFKTVAVKELATEQKFHFEVNQTMTPVLHILCYFMHSSNEVIADSVSVPVEYVPNKMRLHIDGATEAKKKPGDTVTLRINANVGTLVCILGKDERTLTKRNDIKEEDALAGKMTHDTSRYGYRYSYEADVFDIIKNAGLGVVTNFIVPGRYYYHYYYVPKPYRWSRYYYYPYGRSWYYECKRLGPFAAPPGRGFQPVRKYPKEEEEMILPPTLYWNCLSVTDEVETAKFDAPDSLATMNFTAFGVNKDTGLSFVKIPLMLTVEKRVFITSYMPKSAILNEIVCMNTIAHNTGDENATLTLILKKNTDYDNVRIKKDGGDRTLELTSENVKRELGKIEAGTKKVEVFCIKPKVTGDVTVKVSVTGAGNYDVTKTIKIKPEGLKKCKTYPFLVEIGPSEGFSATETVNLPDDVVDKSYTVSTIVAGDPLIATATKLSDLTMTPTGCGEENVLHLSLLSNIIAYLSKTQRMPEGLLTKAKSAMQAAYMQSLSYRRYDGSCSAFGNWDTYGSSRLTAIMAQSLAKAWQLGSNGIKPEPDLLHRCIDFLTLHQNGDGSFIEMGKVLHLDTQGDSAANNISRTAFIALALHDTKKFFDAMDMKIALHRVDSALSSARDFLEENLDTADTYGLAITAYALNVLGSSKAAEAIQKMNKTSTVDGDKMHWDGDDEAQSIEMSAYALMALMAYGAEDNAESVYKWLHTKRKAYGEFGSIQADIVGVEALSMVTSLALKKSFPKITVNVDVVYKKTASKTKSKSAKVHVTKDNAHELQKPDMKWRNKLTPMEIKVDGSVGSTSKKLYAYAEVSVCYHVKSITESGKLSTSVQVLDDRVRSYKLRTCVKRTSSDSQVDNHLVMATIYLPTGYSLNKTASKYGSSVAKARLDEHKLTMYFSSLKRQVCSTLKFNMVKGNVAHIQPARVLVVNKFNADEMCLTDYTLKKREPCDVSKKHPGCEDEEK